MIKKTLLTTLLMLTAFISHASDKHEKEQVKPANVAPLPDYIFTPTDELSAQVAQTLAAAKNEQKLALFVLGAQWCHDSKGLAKNFSTAQMQQVLTTHYQVLFVDVGYLEKGFELVKQFNQPIYYGTPTVMVIDPTDNKLLNKHSMKKWLNAFKVPLNEYVDYFTDIAEKGSVKTAQSQAMLAYLTQIDKFEQQQALRLKEAYGIVGPLLKAYMESDAKKASDDFVDKWQPVQDFRYNIQGDIKALVSQAKNNVKTGSKQALDFPSYPAFAWE
ncbi:MAG: thioredoxin family protein [Colwellia sp.]|nr:thioredoxin family protein [Colwellia sp.]MCW8866045.1 thioredoxin family protein [Colwellia sp.]MCW9081255.1 thioredoxin family protein [Colwellia sp.]